MSLRAKSSLAGVIAGCILSGVACSPADRLVALQLGAEDSAGSSGSEFSAPSLVTGLFADSSVPLHDPTLSADGLELFLSADTGTGSDIWTSTRATADAAWPPAHTVSELSSTSDELDPDLSLDGLTLYLASNRASSGYQLYVSHRGTPAQAWSAPQLMTGLGTSSTDLGPSVDPSGLYMVFASQRGTSDIRLYSASRSDPSGSWQSVTEMSGIDSGMQDQNPALFNMDRSLIWSSRRTRNGYTSDLFEVERASVSVSFSATPTALDTLNSLTDWDGDPWLSQDGRHILFVSERNGNIPHIYEAWR